jgi:hypothetical protein
MELNENQDQPRRKRGRPPKYRPPESINPFERYKSDLEKKFEQEPIMRGDEINSLDATPYI